jgi:glycosyltransferase involved in cell wall biosynthesis
VDSTRRPAVDVIIPALNERGSIPLVLEAIPRDRVREVVVVDNGSTDGTAHAAAAGGSTVVSEPHRGYGSACLAGIEYLDRKTSPPEVVVFLDADYSDHPQELPAVLKPIVEDGADLVIGSRILGRREPGSLLPQARVGNFVATCLIRWFYDVEFTDLGPFRAVRWEALKRLDMQDRDFGWTAEMQVKAAKLRLAVAEVPVSYRRRVGVSKISGTLTGTLRAGHKILYTIFRHI